MPSTCKPVATLSVGLASLLLCLATPSLASGATGRVLHVDQSHARFGGDETGEPTQPFRTISAAAAEAGPGDTILVAPGVYREHIAPTRGGREDAPITYQAAPGHQVFVRGSEVWTPEWKPLADNPDVFTGALDPALFANAVRNPYQTSIIIAGGQPGPDNPLPARPASAFAEPTRKWIADKELGRLPRTLGQLFVDGAPLSEAETLAEVLRVPGTWIVNDEGDGLVVHFHSSSVPLADRLIEISVRDRIFAPARRGLAHIVEVTPV